MPFFIVLCLFLSPQTFGAAKEKPYLMVSVGDSMTAGFAANTNAIRPVDEVPPDSGGDPDVLQPGSSARIPPLGDNKKSFSWTSGLKIQSHSVKLATYLSSRSLSELAVLNVAKTGARIADLSRQGDLILATWKTGDYQAILYVTVLIGANDSCDKASTRARTDDQLKADLNQFFSKLATIQQKQRIHILVSSLPRVPDLAMPEIADQRTRRGVNCRQMQLKIAPMCRAMVNWTNADGYRKRLETVEASNALLQKVVNDATSHFPQLDLTYSASLFQQKIQISDLAADCFHPNRQGQAALSEILWKEQPWFK